MSGNTYDAVPYESFPYEQTHPQHLHVVGRIFGMQPVDFRKARVLELGCASGGNIIPHAASYPESEFVGVDLSTVQIEEGKRSIRELGLKNIKLEAKSILDITEKDGLFDYIICHGILSWVPVQVQEGIFKVCKANLSPNGLAVISYNTLPGWNMVRTVRDMMVYHTQRFENPAERAAQARALLQFVSENANGGSYYSGLIKNEIELLKDQADNYLLHDHLEENNVQYYFHEFMKMANDQGLQYTGDTSVSSMFTGNLPEKAAAVLATSDDIVRTEQYTDFITNRRFRQSILCHQGIVLSRTLQPQIIDEFFLLSYLKPEKPAAEIDLKFDDPQKFNGPVTLTTHNRVATAIFLTLFENNKTPLKANELVQLTLERFEEGFKPTAEVIRANLYDLGLRVFLSGGLALLSDKGACTDKVGDKPAALVVARHQAKSKNWVTNGRHQRLNVDVAPRIIIQYMDGTNDMQAIIDKVMTHFTTGELKLQRDGLDVKSSEVVREEVAEIVTRSIEQLRENGLLYA
jgi:methyltransferase-like protein/cyclopropane fatty-acyl-phospholipid synthase-like methyltransferase